jgi:hypothetical protein
MYNTRMNSKLKRIMTEHPRPNTGGKGHLSAAEVVVVLEELGCAPWHPGALPRFGRVDPAAACLLRGVPTAAAVGGLPPA